MCYSLPAQGRGSGRQYMGETTLVDARAPCRSPGRGPCIHGRQYIGEPTLADARAPCRSPSHRRRRRCQDARTSLPSTLTPNPTVLFVWHLPPLCNTPPSHARCAAGGCADVVSRGTSAAGGVRVVATAQRVLALAGGGARKREMRNESVCRFLKYVGAPARSTLLHGWMHATATVTRNASQPIAHQEFGAQPIRYCCNSL